jgi:hypothetical protein
MIVRARRNTNYTMMSNVGLEDPNLSFKAKGVLAYLLSKPDNWSARDRQLAEVGPDGRDSVQTALKELETHGYLKRERVHKTDGTFEWVSVVFDEPWRENPSTDKPSTDKPSTENPAIINTIVTNTVVTNTEETNNNPLDTSPPSLRSGGSVSAPSDTRLLMLAYEEWLGYVPAAYGKESKAAKELLKRGYAIADVELAYRAIKQQPFWKSKHVSLMVVLEQIGALANYAKEGGDINQPAQRLSTPDHNRQAFEEYKRMLKEQGLSND